MTRRTFSSLAAGTAALSAADDKIRVAMIGTGHGHAFSKIRALRSMPEYDFVGIFRPDPSEPGEGAPLLDVRWLSLKDILDATSIGLVAIESADVEKNLEYAERCVQAGKFLPLDKPPGALCAVDLGDG